MSPGDQKDELLKKRSDLPDPKSFSPRIATSGAGGVVKGVVGFGDFINPTIQPAPGTSSIAQRAQSEIEEKLNNAGSSINRLMMDSIPKTKKQPVKLLQLAQLLSQLEEQYNNLRHVNPEIRAKLEESIKRTVSRIQDLGNEMKTVDLESEEITKLILKVNQARKTSTSPPEDPPDPENVITEEEKKKKDDEENGDEEEEEEDDKKKKKKKPLPAPIEDEENPSRFTTSPIDSSQGVDEDEPELRPQFPSGGSYNMMKRHPNEVIMSTKLHDESLMEYNQIDNSLFMRQKILEDRILAGGYTLDPVVKPSIKPITGRLEQEMSALWIEQPKAASEHNNWEQKFVNSQANGIFTNFTQRDPTTVFPRYERHINPNEHPDYALRKRDSDLDVKEQVSGFKLGYQTAIDQMRVNGLFV